MYVRSSPRQAASWPRCCLQATFSRWKAGLFLVRLGLGLIGPNAGRTDGLGSWSWELGAESLTRLMTAGCHQDRTSQGRFRMLCDDAPTNLEAKVVQVKFLSGGTG